MSTLRKNVTISVEEYLEGVFAAALGMCDRTSKSLSHPRSRGE